MQPDKPTYPIIDLVTPLEELGYGDGIPHEPIAEPGPGFWFALMVAGWFSIRFILWLHS